MSTFEQEELWREAKAFGDSPCMKEVFRLLEERYIADWKNSEPDAGLKRDDAYYMVRAVTALRGELSAMATAPSVAQFNRRLKRA